MVGGGRAHALSLLSIGVPLAGCAGPFSTLEPNGPAAERVATLWWVMLGGSALISTLVAVLIVVAFVKRDSETRVSPKLWIGGFGLGFTSAVLMALLAYALVLGESTLPTPRDGTVAVAAEGRQWDWRFRQPGVSGEIATEGVLNIPVGVPVDVHITTQDVIHSFWVPQLAGKMDAIPGKTNVLRIEASLPGTYEGRCAEFCGIGHAGNVFRVVAHDADGWAAFQRSEPR
ncbi:cytochrome c oxidase subunit II [Mesorhizobium sp. RP14(2022)]|uniref:Cytochrome aa3 subunit 2 n=1 Tax=Mesorhizobium liriopis TaxID=2953882 RepID=A0ABT1C600_9HYPH|nr:cytochrome c oxidase subunit II [Mesorhizobium liriopis]